MAAPRILIVEDEQRLLDRLIDLFREDGFSVFTASTYRDLESMIELPSVYFDVVVLDRLLEDRDSADLIPKIREKFENISILVLSAITTPAEKTAQLQAGADDYVSKPFDGGELIARVKVLLRRNQTEIRQANVVLNSERRTMKVNNTDVPLTNKEFILLRTLMKHPGKIFSKAFLYEKVWEMNSDVDSNVVETTVNKIRRRLEDVGAVLQIKNSRNVGYWVEE